MRTIFRRVFPPAFLRAATARGVDVGAYLSPAKGATGVWVGQTAAQFANACGLCTRLENEYAGKGYPWIGRTRRVLTDPPKQVVERSIERCGRG